MIRSVLVLLLVSSTIAVAAGSPFYLPAYYRQGDFLATTPGVGGDAAGALFNPAIWRLLPSPELQFYWNDLAKDLPGGKNWTLAAGAGGFGFGVQHWDYGEYWQGIPHHYGLYDYHIGVGFGDHANSFGVGYSWSKGDIPLSHPRDNTLTLGYISRPCRHASLGLAGRYALREADALGLFDLGIRPLNSPLLTLFGDAAWGSYAAPGEIEWSAGVALQPVSGINVLGKIMEGGGFSIGIALGLAGATAITHFDDEGKSSYTSYGLRLGPFRNDGLTGLLMKRRSYLKLDFDNQLRYQRYRLFDSKGHTLLELLKTLDRVKDDPAVAGVALRITEEMSGSWELIWEVREKLKELKGSGKRVMVFLERGGMAHYYLASVGDKVMVDPESMVILIGFNLGRTYWANMLDKLGLGFDEWRFFKYKSANETFSRTDMSDGDREQRQALADGFYEVMRGDICASRGLSEAEFDHIVNDVGVLGADSLLAYRLADTTGRWTDMGDWIEQVEGSKKMMIGLRSYAALEPRVEEWGIPPQIAVIYALGPCAMDYGINGRRLQKVISGAREDGRIKAVVFRADSPGGDPLPSDIVAEELKKTAEKKPVIVSQGWVAGSGGYWISMNGDKIVASPWTITGSIGVIGGWIYNKGFGDKLGLSYDHVQRGAHADLPGGIVVPLIGAQIPERNLTPEERSYMETTIRLLYAEFVRKVAEGRGMAVEKVEEVAQGRVWIGAAARQIGLVDELGGIERATQMARQAAGIKPERRVELVEMPDKGLINPDLFQPKMLGIRLTSRREDQQLELQYLRMILQAQGRPMALMPPDLMMSGLNIE